MITKLSSFTYCILVGILLAIVAEAAPVTLSNAGYFRSRIADPYPEYQQVLIEATPEPGAGTTVTATSLIDNSYQVQLNADPCFSSFSTRIPFQGNPEPRLLSGFEINAVNGPDATALTTHDIAGTHPMPFVQQISISASDLLTPTVSWALPSVTHAANRIRVRAQGPDCFQWTSNALPGNATTFTFPDSILEPAKEYKIRVMLEEVRNGNLVNRSEQRLPYSTAGPLCRFPSQFRMHRGPNDFPVSPAGDFIWIGGCVMPVNASVTASQGSQQAPLPFSGLCEFGQYVPYSASLTGATTITAEINGQTCSMNTNTIAGVQQMPLVENLAVSGGPKALTVSWTLPVTGVPRTQIQLRVYDLATGQLVFRTQSLDKNATSYVLPEGILAAGKNYVIRVDLIDSPPDKYLNRSQTYLTYQAPDVIPLITANGASNAVSLPEGAPLHVHVKMDAASAVLGLPVDWWVAADAFGGWYSYNYATKSWVFTGASPAALTATYQGPLSNLTFYEILNTNGLPIGQYSVYFGVDSLMNGSLDLGQIYYDGVLIDIQ